MPILSQASTTFISPASNQFLNVDQLRDSEKRESILIVDDSPTMRAAFVNRLARQYKCTESSTVMEALAELREREYAIVIADIQMPGLSGVELLRRIVEIYPNTAVIMVSGIDRPQRVLDVVRLGAFDYLIKPCDMDILELTVERAVERRNLLVDAKRYKADLETRNEELATGKAQLERLQTQIVQNAKMASLGQLAAGVAHELNNPVGFIYGNIDILQSTMAGFIRLMEFYDRSSLPGGVAAEADAIKKQIDYETTLSDLESIMTDCREGAERIRDIVKNLRTFSRLDEAEFKKTDVHEGIDSTLRLLSRYFTSDKINLVREYSEDLPLIDAYAGQLNQVWMNLLVNAAQAVTPAGGTVRIETTSDGEYVTVLVEDSGVGIEAAVLDRIFDPFFTTKPVGEGTGLGLSISFGIVDRHGGNIQVRSRPGSGTVFKVRLRIDADRPLNTLGQIR